VGMQMYIVASARLNALHMYGMSREITINFNVIQLCQCSTIRFTDEKEDI